MEGVEGQKGVSISIRELSISLRSHKREKLLVQPLSVFIPGGSLFGIVGGSGSGKTSLLNVLADRYDKQAFEVKGSAEFGAGRGPSVGVGYVTQSDHTLPFLTVRETLTFASYLKIDDRDEDRASVVEAILLDLGLKEAAETRVGDASVGGIRGISGGERRRLSVGLQILSSPEVLYCDECTSGEYHDNKTHHLGTGLREPSPTMAPSLPQDHQKHLTPPLHLLHRPGRVHRKQRHGDHPPAHTHAKNHSGVLHPPAPQRHLQPL